MTREEFYDIALEKIMEFIERLNDELTKLKVDVDKIIENIK